MSKAKQSKERPVHTPIRKKSRRRKPKDNAKKKNGLIGMRPEGKRK